MVEVTAVYDTNTANPIPNPKPIRRNQPLYVPLSFGLNRVLADIWLG